MELRQLRYFVAVAEERSISSAAKRLHVVQSAISHQMASLEAELGAQLLLRSKLGVQLTAGGQLLYTNALAILKHVEAVTIEVQNVEKTVKGHVVLGLPHSTAAVLAAALVEAVTQAFPQVVLTVIEGLSGDLQQDLISGKLDFAVLFDVAEDPALRRTTLFSEMLHFVTADPALSDLRRSNAGIPLPNVLRRPLILPPAPHGVRRLLQHKADQLGLKPRVVAEMTGVVSTLDAVRRGVGDSVMMSVNARQRELPEVTIVPISAPTIERIAAVHEPARFDMPIASRSVRNLMVELVAALVEREEWSGARLLLPTLERSRGIVGMSIDCRTSSPRST